MLPVTEDTIVAIATAPGRGAVGIVRVSGPRLKDFARELLGRELEPRYATYLPFRDHDEQTIDHGLALYFPAPHSYTGEDVLELQAHGGTVVLQLLLARCLAVGKSLKMPMRLANPGEFTQRAFLNDKMDLAQAEAVADLIDASTEAAARSASRSLSGAFSQEIDTLSKQVVELRMLVEATLDFPEEEIDFLQKANALGRLEKVLTQLERVFDRTRQGVLLRDGVTVVLAGQPNAGKSSLLNALAGAELAIVTPIAGTTRDKVSETIQIEGVPLHVIDTAGLRESDDEVERIGVERSWQAIKDADAVVFLHDLSRRGQSEYDAAEHDIEQRIGGVLADHVPIVHVGTKSDLAHQQVLSGELSLSTKTGEGLQMLRQRLLTLAGWHAEQGSTEGIYSARARHIDALQRARQHIQQAFRLAQLNDQSLDLLAEELRLGHEAMCEILGIFTADDLLGEIFNKFCIGK